MSKLIDHFDWTWLATALIGLITYFVAQPFFKRRGLPRGPTPLPVIGNLLVLRGKNNIGEQIQKYRAKYGDVFTLWLGPSPTVVVCGWDRIKEALLGMKNTFSGRNCRHTGNLFLEGHQDVIMSNFGQLWETLRKLFVLAVRKYTVSEKLPILVNDVLDQVVPLMLDKQEAIDPNDFLYLTIYNILASTAFGKRYNMEDEEFLNLKNSNDAINSEFNAGTIWDIYPFLRHFLKKRENKLRGLIRNFFTPLRNQYKLHKEAYTSGIIRDFTDACLAAKEEAEKEDKGTAEYFTDENMVLVIFDLFSAGSDTTRNTLAWTLLYLSHYTEIQEKLREEITQKIGPKLAVQSDKRKCPYVMAVIAEILRLRPIVGFTMEHKATRDTEFAGFQIPKDTCIIFDISAQHKDSAFWEDPEVFRPERFLLKDGQFLNTAGLTGYIPFGLGRRACPGEKLALADLFLLLTGLIQRCRFSLPEGPGTGVLEPMNILSFNIPQPFKLKIEKA